MISKLRNRINNKKGFTLVELIVVIVIVLVMAAALVPSVMKYVERARMANCQQEASAILTQVQADFAASQESAQTGIAVFSNDSGAWSCSYTIGDVTVSTSSVSTSPSAVVTISAEDDATTIGGADIYNVTGLAYNNGTYTAEWSRDDGWQTQSNQAME